MRRLLGHDSILRLLPIYGIFIFVGIFVRSLLDGESGGGAALYGLASAGVLTVVFVVVEGFRSRNKDG